MWIDDGSFAIAFDIDRHLAPSTLCIFVQLLFEKDFTKNECMKDASYIQQICKIESKFTYFVLKTMIEHLYHLFTIIVGFASAYSLYLSLLDIKKNDRASAKSHLIWFLILSVIFCIFFSINKCSATKEDNTINQEATLICDRNKELGCKISIDDSFISDYVTDNKVSPELKTARVHFAAGISFATSIVQILNDENQESTFKNNGCFPIFIQTKSPNNMEGCIFNMSIVKNKIHFEGKLFDIKNKELLGWFNGEEFGIVKQCSFSWNMDEKGVEIIDNYGNVAFSINTEQIKNSYGDKHFLRYRGYFKYKENYYVIDDETLITPNLDEAIEKIENITHIFDHFGTKKLGVRL